MTGLLARRRLSPLGLVVASWRLFRLAPTTAAALGVVGVATAVVLERGATAELSALAEGRVEVERLGQVAAAVVSGWAADCVLKGLWARLAWEAPAGEPTSVATLWRRLRGAWGGVGLPVAYATLAAAALTWPRLLALVGTLRHPTWAAAATAAGALGAAWLALRSVLAVPAAAVEHLGGPASWATSWRLTRGRLGVLCLLLPLPPLLGLAVGQLVGALLPATAGGTWAASVAGAVAQVSLAGLPGTLFRAWRRA